MKKIIAAAVALVLSSSVAQAAYNCQPVFYQQFDPKLNGYVTIRGVDQCQYYPDPPPYYQPPAYYPPPPGEYYEGGDGDVASALIGGALGFGLGYVVGNNNNSHNHKNYYYYNGGHNNYYNGGHNNYYNGGYNNRPKHYKYPGGWNNGQGRAKFRKPKNN